MRYKLYDFINNIILEQFIFVYLLYPAMLQLLKKSLEQITR